MLNKFPITTTYIKQNRIKIDIFLNEFIDEQTVYENNSFALVFKKVTLTEIKESLNKSFTFEDLDKYLYSCLKKEILNSNAFFHFSQKLRNSVTDNNIIILPYYEGNLTARFIQYNTLKYSNEGTKKLL